ncbi:MAG: hypothetical protein ACK4M4_10845, partial [Flavobacterium sp.]
INTIINMSSNKSEKAIKALRIKCSELSEIKNVQQGNTWKASLKDSLISYLGNDSAIITRLEDLYFTKKTVSDSPDVISLVNVYDESKKENFKNLIDNSISHIQTHGVFEVKTSGNFLKDFNNTQLISGLFVAVTLIFGIGRFVGGIEKEREIIEVKNEIESTKTKLQKETENNENLKKEINLLKTLKGK